MSGPLFDIAKEWLRAEKPHLYDLTEDDAKDLAEDAAKLEQLLIQTQNDAITACAATAMSMTCHCGDQRQLRSDTVMHILAMKRPMQPSSNPPESKR